MKPAGLYFQSFEYERVSLLHTIQGLIWIGGTKESGEDLLRARDCVKGVSTPSCACCTAVSVLQTVTLFWNLQACKPYCYTWLTLCHASLERLLSIQVQNSLALCCREIQELTVPVQCWLTSDDWAKLCAYGCSRYHRPRISAESPALQYRTRFYQDGTPVPAS